MLSVSTQMSHSMLAKCLVLCCSLEFESNNLTANLMILAIDDLDCILGINLLKYLSHKIDSLYPLA